MIMVHGMEYDSLPEWFLAFDIYIPEEKKFLDSFIAEKHLKNAGFCTVPTLKSVKNYQELEILANEKSCFSSKEKREGVYVKISDGKWQTH